MENTVKMIYLNSLVFDKKHNLRKNFKSNICSLVKLSNLKNFQI